MKKAAAMATLTEALEVPRPIEQRRRKTENRIKEGENGFPSIEKTEWKQTQLVTASSIPCKMT